MSDHDTDCPDCIAVQAENEARIARGQIPYRDQCGCCADVDYLAPTASERLEMLNRAYEEGGR